MAVKSSVYLLPDCAESREDFEWIRTEIVAQGGEAIVFAAAAVDDLSQAEVREAFAAARRDDWRELRERGAALLAQHPPARPVTAEERRDLERQLRALRARAERLARLDVTEAAGRGEALAVLAAIEGLLAPGGEAERAPRTKRREDFQGRVWLTRPHPGIDRMASAWLIRRFVDPEATFRFADRIPREEAVVPFDMFGVELGHRGERVTFETLMHDFGLRGTALDRVARLVHDVDLRVEPARDPEAATVAALVEGLRASFTEDAVLLDHGAALFEALYSSFHAAAAAG